MTTQKTAVFTFELMNLTFRWQVCYQFRAQAPDSPSYGKTSFSLLSIHTHRFNSLGGTKGDTNDTMAIFRSLEVAGTAELTHPYNLIPMDENRPVTPLPQWHTIFLKERFDPLCSLMPGAMQLISGLPIPHCKKPRPVRDGDLAPIQIYNFQ